MVAMALTLSTPRGANSEFEPIVAARDTIGFPSLYEITLAVAIGKKDLHVASRLVVHQSQVAIFI